MTPGSGADLLIAIGETMALFTPRPVAPLKTATAFALETAGAESNVACCAAQLGLPAAWLSRVGSDALGERVVRGIAAFGVDVSAVERDPSRPTGVMLKAPGEVGTEVSYYRTGSAASAMTPSDLDRVVASADRAIVHLTGVTPALSESCRALADAILLERRLGGGAAVSFDVNHRPRLWPDRSAAPELTRLARRSEVCFVGLDEAQDLWGTPTADAVRRHLSEPPVLVVKDGAREATVFSQDFSPVVVAALPVEVLEPVGAGDAFAGGFLTALAAGADLKVAARSGHLAAARVLRSPVDVVAQPPFASLGEIVNLSDDDWDGLQGEHWRAGVAT